MVKMCPMPKFDDALRGYAAEILKRDDYKCRYCGVDGTQSFDTWLSLSWDHLLPKGHPKRDDPDYIVAACHFCNTAANHYFEQAEQLGLKFDDMTPEQLVAQRLPYVLRTRESYREYWESVVVRERSRSLTSPARDVEVEDNVTE